MQVFNVIEKDFDEIFVYTFSTYEKAKEYFDECHKHLLRMQDCETDKELIKKFDLGEDSVIINDDYIDIYSEKYELYIEEQTLDVGYDFENAD